MKTMRISLSIVPLICHFVFGGCGFDAPDYSKDRGTQIRSEVADVMKETNVTQPPGHDLVKASSGSCNGAMVTLHPVQFNHGFPDFSGSCAKVGASEVRVWIFSNGYIVREASLPCIVDRIELGCMEQGTYYIAAIGGFFDNYPEYIAGMILLSDVFPDYRGCDHFDGNVPRFCAPVEILVSGRGELLVPITLYCDDLFNKGSDVCGES